MEKECFQHFYFSRRSFQGFDMPLSAEYWSIGSTNVVILKHADYRIHEKLGKNLIKALLFDKEPFLLASFSTSAREDAKQKSKTFELLK
jgi:hypothetical protein